MKARPGTQRRLRVGIDAQLAVGTATGIGEYVRGLCDALVAAGCDVVPLRAPAIDPWRFDRRVLWDQVLLPLAAARADVDVLHCAAGTMPLAARGPVVATVHDVAWLRVQSHARAYARAYFGAFALARYERAGVIFVDSTFSRDELLAVAPRLDPSRISVLYPGVAADVAAVMRRPLGSERADGVASAAPTALVVGTVEARKNLEVLVRVAAAIPELRVISVGPFTPYRDRILALAAELGVSERIELRGYVTRSEVLELYATATFAAMPSRYEGFGYGAAQALCAGIPLVVSNAASLPEIVGDAWPTSPPDDVEAWVDACRAILCDRAAANVRAQRVRDASAARFAWATTAASALVAYEAAAG